MTYLKITDSQRGQAMSEFLVSMVWAIPFVFMFVAIGHMISIETETHKAARYVAWERVAYSGDEYQARLDDSITGFDNEVARRFFMNGEAGFADGLNSSRQRWEDWESGETAVNLADGISIEAPEPDDTFLSRAEGFLESNASQVNWLQDRSDVEVNSITTARMRVELSTDNSYALTDVTGFTPSVDSSYVLIADGWAPGNEAMYSERVDGVRNLSLRQAQPFFQNSAITRSLAVAFDEMDQHMFVDDDNPSSSFDMVSETQSTSVPGVLLETYQP